MNLNDISVYLRYIAKFLSFVIDFIEWMESDSDAEKTNKRSSSHYNYRKNVSTVDDSVDNSNDNIDFHIEDTDDRKGE